MKWIFFLITILLLINFVSSADWTPQGDINLRDVYDINNGVNATFQWFNGLFNWTAIGDYLSFDGATLSFNETFLNNTIATESLKLGFNSTYNATYATWAYNETIATFTLYNSSWDQQYLKQWDYNQTTGTFNNYNDTWDNSWLNIFGYNQTIATFNLYNSTWDNSYLNQWDLNETLATYNLWGIYWYNQSTGIFDAYNSSWDQQYLAKWDYNQSTATFDNYNITWDNSWLNRFGYNHTADTYSLWGIFWYNQSDGTFGMYNSSWDQSYMDKWDYNESTATYDMYDERWRSTYNSTYDAKVTDNQTWNQSHADALYIAQSEEGNLNVNSSENWDNLNSPNSTQMENNGGELNIKQSWFIALWNSIFGTKTTDDLTEGSTNLYDNETWNQSLGDTLYSGIEWDYNQTSAANTLWGANWYNHTLSTFNLWGANFYNHTLDTFNLWDGKWSSTFNSTYDALVTDNQTFNQSFVDSRYAGIVWAYNETTATFSIHNITWDQSYLDRWDHNQTLATYNLWGIYFYNQTLETFEIYNSSWDQSYLNQWDYNQTLAAFNLWGTFWYNHTLDTYNLWNGIWSTTYNATYNLWSYNQTTATSDVYNSSWDQSYLDKWDYNQTEAVAGGNASFDQALTDGLYANTNIDETFDEHLTVTKNLTVEGDRINLGSAEIDQSIWFYEDGSLSERLYWNDGLDRIASSTDFHTFGSITGTGRIQSSSYIYAVDFLQSDSDIKTTGAGDDLWLGTSTQANALFRAYANGSVNAVSYIGNGSGLTDVPLTESDPIFTAWDNITGIPTATPSDGDTTHFSLADEIYDWVIGLGYLAGSTIDSLISGNVTAVYTAVFGDADSNYTQIYADMSAADLSNKSEIFTTADLNYTKIYSDIDTNIIGNVSGLIGPTNVAWINESNTFGENQDFDDNNLTGIDYVKFEDGGYMYDNGTTLIIGHT